jgi:hypothetical protein
MKAALALIAISTLNALTASPAPGGEFRPAKNAIAEATHTRLVELPMKAGPRSGRPSSGEEPQIHPPHYQRCDPW